MIRKTSNQSRNTAEHLYPNPEFRRRRFIKSIIVGTALSRLAGYDSCLRVVAACQPTVSGNGIIEVNVSQFPALGDSNGSVRLLLNALQGSRPSGPLNPILVNRGADNQFYSLSARCPHQGCTVGAF